MSDAQNFGFAQFVPGFDFLQNLAKGAATGGMPQMPGLSNWIAPTLSVEELEKRISELRAVMFWLEQNGKALQATIQALEVQKMTLATLKGMDMTMADMAEALKVKTPAAEPASDSASKAAAGGQAAGKPADGADAGAGAHNVVDPLQWWSSLTQQFQQIAANAMQQAAQNNPMEAAREAATGMAEQAIEAASRMGAAAAGAATAAAPKAPARKAGAKAATGASTRTSAKEAGTASRKTAAPRKSAGGRSTTR